MMPASIRPRAATAQPGANSSPTNQAEGIVAVDFFHIDTVLGRRLYALAFLEHGTRRLLTGVTAHPTRDWAVQQARNLTADLSTPIESLRFLLRDRDDKYSAAFDAVFEAENMEVLKSAPQTPRMNAHCERVIGSIRRETLDHVLITGETHARRILGTYQQHYNEHRPYQAGTSYRPIPTSNPPSYMTFKATNSCAPASSAASPTSTDTRPDVQR